jgi:small subunit ribosomal protein S20
MANHKSALKRIRQNDKRRLRNRFHKVRMRTSIKKFRTAVEGGDVDVARETLASTVRLVQRTRSRGVIHRNTADRMVSRLNKAFNKLANAQG